jgi:hypothetical protein
VGAQPVLDVGEVEGGAGLGAADRLREVIAAAAPVDDGGAAHPGRPSDLGQVHLGVAHGRPPHAKETRTRTARSSPALAARCSTLCPRRPAPVPPPGRAGLGRAGPTRTRARSPSCSRPTDADTCRSRRDRPQRMFCSDLVAMSARSRQAKSSSGSWRASQGCQSVRRRRSASPALAVSPSSVSMGSGRPSGVRVVTSSSLYPGTTSESSDRPALLTGFWAGPAPPSAHVVAPPCASRSTIRRTFGSAPPSPVVQRVVEQLGGRPGERRPRPGRRRHGGRVLGAGVQCQPVHGPGEYRERRPVAGDDLAREGVLARAAPGPARGPGARRSRR